MEYYLAWAIPLAPLAAAIVCSFLAWFQPNCKWAHIPAWIGLTLAAVAALAALASTRVEGTGSIAEGYTWLEIGRANVTIALQLDAISLVQVCVVTFVAALVGFYSAGYMHADPAPSRYFAIFSAFVFCMVMLVLSSNLLVLYMFWEGVGLCSYLLIGFWHQRPTATRAATKAFLVNRLADSGFLLGILLLWQAVGDIQPDGLARLDYNQLFAAVPALAAQHPTLLSFAAALLLLGAIGKSAQFPLYVWLPDAMEGPTPVSALIHAATMVTAGVFLLCRMSPLLVFAPDVLVLAGWLGAITALLAAAIALFQDDLKRVLAYSTVSQLGYLFMALSCGAERHLMPLAVTAALFHVATHAFFKALLFLSAGNVMHAMGDVIDMRKFSGLRSVLPRTRILFLIGCSALAGLPLLSGFWSKDGILGLLMDASRESEYAFSFNVFLAVGLTTALLTACYSFRAYHRTFHGSLKLPSEAGTHAHEAPMGMIWPLGVLAIGSLLLGLAVGPTGVLSGYLHHIPYLAAAEHAEHHWVMFVVSSLIALAGAFIGWSSSAKQWRFAWTGAAGLALSRAGKQRFYVDELLLFSVVKPIAAFAHLLSKIDVRGIDGLWRQVVMLPGAAGLLFSRLQRGHLGGYAALMTLGLLAYVVLTALRGIE